MMFINKKHHIRHGSEIKFSQGYMFHPSAATYNITLMTYRYLNPGMFNPITTSGGRGMLIPPPHKYLCIASIEAYFLQFY